VIWLSGKKLAEDVPSIETPTKNLEPIQQAFNDIKIHSIYFNKLDNKPKAGPLVTYAD